MERILATVLKKNNKKLFLTLLPLLLVIGVLSIFSWLTPRWTTLQIDDSSPTIDTTYAYKAIVKPNVLHPNGGTIDVGDTIYKKITTAIPIDLRTVLNATEEISVKGTHDVQLIISAGDNWKRAFPLQNKEGFEQTGMEITVIDNSYRIDLAQVEIFLRQVEEEIGVKHGQYDIEIVPTIEGIVESADTVMEINNQDKLRLTYLQDEIILASERSFSTALQLTDSQIANPVSILGISLPLLPVRIISTCLFIVLLLSIIFSLFYLDEGPVKRIQSEAEKINKKYGKRVIRITKKIDFVDKTIVPFATFKLMLKIADEIEQPILFYENNHSQLYIVVDMLCVYTYEPSIIETMKPVYETILDIHYN